MAYSNTDYTQKASSYTPPKIVDWIVNLINTNCTTLKLDLATIQHEIDRYKFMLLSESGSSLFMDFKDENQMKIIFSCESFDFKFEYAANAKFPNGRHIVSVNENSGEAVSKAIQQFAEHFKNNAFGEQTENIISTDDNEIYVLKDLHFIHDGKNTRQAADFTVNAEGVQWNEYDPPGVHYLIASGSGGSVTLQEFSKGKLDDFVLRNFGQEVLDEAKKNVAHRLKSL
ncbi:MAG: hypothetical protein H6582_08280 [Crocinitomicaceae bacterium]|nr:hypothetical protein [Crocinitomicaceae bacterium]